MFGVLDRLHLAPATTEKREIKNSIAILGKLRKAYDRQVEQNFRRSPPTSTAIRSRC